MRASASMFRSRVHAPEECLLDAIAVPCACDGEVNEEELTRAVTILRDLPAFQGRDALEIESAVGEAFERYSFRRSCDRRKVRAPGRVGER